MSYTPRFIQSIALVVLLCSAAPTVSRAEESAMLSAVRFPDRIRISKELIPHLEAMLEMSPTFRQQYERVMATPKLILTARVDPTFPNRTFRARSSMRRYDSGLLMVLIDIGPGLSPVEWIAHEFEHVLEQLEGVPLIELAEHRRQGAFFSGGGMVETARAMRAGRVVVGEMRSGRAGEDERRLSKTLSDKFVE